MTIDRMLSLFATIVSVVAVPASGYLSYHYAIKGEKRKEFNGVADSLRKKLREQTRRIEQGFYPASGTMEIQESEIDELLDVSKNSDRQDIKSIWNGYLSALDSSGGYNEHGEFVIHDLAPVRQEIEALMRYVERR